MKKEDFQKSILNILSFLNLEKNIMLTTRNQDSKWENFSTTKKKKKWKLGPLYRTARKYIKNLSLAKRAIRKMH